MTEIRDFVLAVDTLRPGAERTIKGTTYQDLVWHDRVQTKPTEAEIAAQLVIAKETYRVPTCVIVDRLIIVDKLTAANSALEANPSQKARFYTRGYVYSNNQEAIDFLRAIGADPAVILARPE